MFNLQNSEFEFRILESDAATIVYRMDKQQGLTIQHRELYSISSDKP